MSYSISYNAIGIRTSKGIIPMELSGDNNVWNYNNKGRSRSWGNMSYITHDKVAVTPEEFSELVEAFHQRVSGDEGYTDKDFGWHSGIAVYGHHTGTTTWGTYRNMLMRAMNNVISLDLAISLGLKAYHWEGYEQVFDNITCEEDIWANAEKHYNFVFQSYHYTVRDRIEDIADSIRFLNTHQAKSGCEKPYYVYYEASFPEFGTEYLKCIEDGKVITTSKLEEAMLFKTFKGYGLQLSDMLRELLYLNKVDWNMIGARKK